MNKKHQSMKTYLNHTTAKKIASIALVLLLFIAATVVISSCSKFNDDLDFDKLTVSDWNTEIAIPLVNSTFAIKDFFGDENQEFLHVDPDGLISLVYSSDELVSAKAEDFINLPDQSFSLTIPLDVTSAGVIDTIPYDFSYIFLRESEDQRIDSVFLKGGTLRISGETDLNKDESNLVVKLPELIHRQTGEQLLILIPLDNPSGLQPTVAFNTQVNLGEYTLAINKDGTGMNNEINFNSELIVYPDANPNNSPYEITVEIEFSDMEFQQFFGYLGNYSIPFEDSIAINIYQNALGGGIELGADALSFIVNTRNSIGVPVTFEAETFYVYSPLNEPYYADIFLFGQGNPNMFEILSPGVDEIGQTIETNIDFSQTNFPEVFLSLAPRKLYYDFAATLNAFGDSTDQNFIQDTSRLAFGTSLELQIYTAIGLLSFQDTLDFNLNNSPDEIDYMLCRINAENGFPLSALIQVYFTDASYNVIDSLIHDDDERVILGGTIGLPPRFRVTAPGIKTTDIMIDKGWLDNVMKAEKMLLRAGLKTTEGNVAKIYDNYSLSLKIGMKTGLDITSNN
jgi:hypothetical protein